MVRASRVFVGSLVAGVALQGAAVAAPPPDLATLLERSGAAGGREPVFVDVGGGKTFGAFLTGSVGDEAGPCPRAYAFVARRAGGSLSMAGKVELELPRCDAAELIEFELVSTGADLDGDGRAEATLEVTYGTESVPGVGSDYLTRFVVVDLETVEVELQTSIADVKGASLGPHYEAHPFHMDVNVDGHLDLIVSGTDCEGDDEDLEEMHCTPNLSVYLYDPGTDRLHPK